MLLKSMDMMVWAAKKNNNIKLPNLIHINSKWPWCAKQANEFAVERLRIICYDTTKGMIKWPFCNDVETVCIHNKSHFFSNFFFWPVPGINEKTRKKLSYFVCAFACATIFFGGGSPFVIKTSTDEYCVCDKGTREWDLRFFMWWTTKKWSSRYRNREWNWVSKRLKRDTHALSLGVLCCYFRFWYILIDFNVSHLLILRLNKQILLKHILFLRSG